MNLLLKEFKKFSRENWWVYLLFIWALIVVAYTWNWNLVEIILLFIANFFANICVMVMQDSFSEKNPKLWTLYQVLGTIIFLILGVYWLFYLWQSQYILWQIAYILSAVKTYFYFNKNNDLKLINAKLLSFLNIIFFVIFYIYFANNNIALLIQAIWFWFSSTWFVVLDDKKRYFTILIWTWLIIIGSLLITYNSFIAWNLDWIALGYFILSWTVGIYFIKLLKKYL
jgi:hypothetical protein